MLMTGRTKLVKVRIDVHTETSTIHYATRRARVKLSLLSRRKLTTTPPRRCREYTDYDW